MPSVCESPIRGLAMRATRLTGCGAPDAGADGFAVSAGFITIGLSANIDDGNEILVRTASGAICVNEPACRTLTRYDVSIEFCEVDPELFELIAGQDLVLDYDGNSVGFQVDEDINCTGGFGLEVWSSIAGDLCNEANQTNYWYWLLPWVANGIIGGDITIEDGPISFTFEGRTKSGHEWGQGPYDVVAQDALLTPGPLLSAVPATKHMHAQIVEIEPPTAACGAQELVIAS